MFGSIIRWPKSVTAISICSRQFQFAHGNFNFTHGNFNLLTAISVCSRQFQFVHGNFNLLTAISILLTAISICSRQFQFTHGNFNLLTAILIAAISILLTAISIYSRQLRNFTQSNFNCFQRNAHGIFRFSHHLSATAAGSGHAPKVKTQNQKWIFKLDLQREK